MKEEKISIEALKSAAELSRAKSKICYTRETHKHPHLTDLIAVGTYTYTYDEGWESKAIVMKLYEDGSFDIEN